MWVAMFPDGERVFVVGAEHERMWTGSIWNAGNCALIHRLGEACSAPALGADTRGSWRVGHHGARTPETVRGRTHGTLSGHTIGPGLAHPRANVVGPFLENASRCILHI